MVGGARVDEGRLLVALQLGEGTPVDVVDRMRVQFGSRGHPRGRAPSGGREKKPQTEKILCQIKSSQVINSHNAFCICAKSKQQKSKIKACAIYLIFASRVKGVLVLVFVLS